MIFGIIDPNGYYELGTLFLLSISVLLTSFYISQTKEKFRSTFSNKKTSKLLLDIKWINFYHLFITLIIPLIIAFPLLISKHLILFSILLCTSYLQNIILISIFTILKPKYISYTAIFLLSFILIPNLFNKEILIFNPLFSFSYLPIKLLEINIVFKVLISITTSIILVFSIKNMKFMYKEK